MGYNDNTGFASALLTHQIIRQKVIGGGLNAQLEELFWYTQKRHAIDQNETLLVNLIQMVGNARLNVAKEKLVQLSSKIDTMTLLEKQALFVEAYRELELIEELLDG